MANKDFFSKFRVMNPKLKEKIIEALESVLPITLIVLAISILIIPMDLGSMVVFMAGAMLLVVGMGLFQLGAEMAMTPLGEGIGAEMSKTGQVLLMALVGFLMGTIITISEPDLQVLAEQVPAIPNMTLIITVAVGVGIFLAIAIIRILLQISLSAMLTVFYIAVIVLSFFVPKNFIAVAFDSGGVTTGPMTVPFIMALGVGLASVRSDKNAASDSFGLVALSSIGPILAVLLLGSFYTPEEAVFSLSSMTHVETTRDVVLEFMYGLPRYFGEVAASLLPVFGVFVIFQLISHRYRKGQSIRLIIGFIYTYIGLVLFLCGVNVGFAPIGSYIGSAIAGSGNAKWLLIPIGMLIGYYIVKAEPAIQVLNRQVDSVTNGSISAKTMNACLSIGVSISVGLAMVRVLTGIPIYWIIIPGYITALVLSFIVPKIFIGIAFDSGGVASGPMTTTFLLPLSIGACQAVGGNVMTDAFGVVALVALTPLIAVQLMGLSFKLKTRKKDAEAKVSALASGDIIEFEEEWYA